MTTTQPTRERILDAALELFATRGFRDTTVGDIEEAAGLTRRAGALYRYFDSKEAVLRAALERFVESTAQVSSQALDLLPLGDPRAELTLIARLLVAHFAENGKFIRIIQQEGRRFPELVGEMYERAVAPAYQVGAEWLRRDKETGGLAVDDPQALAAVTITPFVAYQIEQELFGAPPGGVEPERFIEAWVELLCHFAGGTSNGGKHT